MKIVISIENQETLPSINNLVKAMWSDAIEFSIVCDSSDIHTCTALTLSWDKWLNDSRWKGNDKFKEYIYFEISNNQVVIEIDNSATFVDLRAYYIAIDEIYSKAGLQISLEGAEIIDYYTFRIRFKKYLECSFEDANEKSLKSN